MINDCVKLGNSARVVRATIEEGGFGVVLAKHNHRWVVWHVFRAKRATMWNCRAGRYTNDQARAEEWYVEAVDALLPQVSCPECGYYYNDPDEGCDACATKKVIPSTTVGVV